MGYLTVPQINTAIIRLAARYPGVCALITLPEVTYEGRATFALRIGTRSPHGSGFLDPFRRARPPVGVLFICGVHARERGGPEIGIAFAADLLWAYEHAEGLRYGGKEFTATEIEQIVERLNVLVVPMVNPDGVHHVVQNPTSMWRKNRNPADGGGNPACYGVDINRNFPFLWDFTKQFAPGVLPASTNPCTDTYHGRGAASEPETRNVRWLLDEYPIISRFKGPARPPLMSFMARSERLKPTAPRSSSASPPVKPAGAAAMRGSCPWKSGTPTVRATMGSRAGWGIATGSRPRAGAGWQCCRRCAHATMPPVISTHQQLRREERRP